MSLRFFLFLGCAFVLAACGSTPQEASSNNQNPVEVKAAQSEPMAKDDGEEIAESLAALPSTEVEAEEDKPKEEPINVPEIDILKGKSTDDIKAVFGKPVLLRKDAPAQIWQYLTKACALHLVFYPEKGKSGPLTVQYISMNDRKTVTDVKTSACFESQLRRVGAAKAKALS
jgi:hypothetical protein